MGKFTPRGGPDPLLVLGTLAIAGMVGFSAYQSRLTMQATQASLNDISQQLQALAEQQRSQVAPEEFGQVVSESIEAYMANKQQQAARAKFAPYQNAPEDPIDGRWIYGQGNARFTLVEFSDYECPYCKRFHDTPKEVVDASNGVVNWEFQHFPLGFHDPAASENAHAAECLGEQLGNRGFWVATEEIFNRTQSNGGGVADLGELAASIGADTEAFQQCMASGRYEDKIQEHMSRGQQLGVSGTPATYVVDNQTGRSQMLGGAQPAEAIASVIRRMMSDSSAGS